MAAKRKAAKKAGTGAVAAGKAARSNEYVQRFIEDEDLRENLREAYESARTAYGRIDGKGPAKALLDDRKTRNELKDAASSLRQAADALRGTKRKRSRRRRGGLLLVLLAGGVAAVLMSEGARNKLLDTLFGAEEEFEYTSTTVPPAPTEPAQTAGTT